MMMMGSHATVLPVDRSLIWPAVLEIRDSKQWSIDDEIALQRQLGYLPGNVIRVVARGHDVGRLLDDNDAPVTVQLYPIVLRDEHNGGKAGRRFKSRIRKTHSLQRQQQLDQQEAYTKSSERPISNAEMGEKSSPNMLIEPFPTIYWLTHPLLRCLVSKLELEGYGVHLEGCLSADPDALASMHRAHAAYGQERWNLLTARDIDTIKARNWESAFAVSRGVAGISNKNHGAVKCLHAHSAHYLSGGAGSSDNIVGKWVMEEINRRWYQPDDTIDEDITGS
jgi:hypothetical protein